MIETLARRNRTAAETTTYSHDQSLELDGRHERPGDANGTKADTSRCEFAIDRDVVSAEGLEPSTP
jgi:hypothetical protein